MADRSHRARVPVAFPAATLGTCKHCGRECAVNRRTHDECAERQRAANDYRGAAAQREGLLQRCDNCRRVEGESYRVPGDYPGGWKWERTKIQRDHPQELIDNGPRDWTVALCTRCHADKTAEAKARRKGTRMPEKRSNVPVPVAPWRIAVGVAFGMTIVSTYLQHIRVDSLQAAQDAAITVAVTFGGSFLGALVVAWLVLRTAARRRDAVERLGDAVGRLTNTSPARVRMKVRPWGGWRNGQPVRASLRYSSHFDDEPGSAARERVEDVVTRKVGQPLDFTWSPARDRLTWAPASGDVADRPEQAPVVDHGARVAEQQTRVEGSVRAAIRGDVTFEWGASDAVGPLSVVVRYPSSYNDDAPDVRQALVDKVNSKAPGRWRATWDTESNAVRFERRPPMPSMIPNPVSADHGPDATWSLPFGVDESGNEVDWSLRIAPHCLIVGPSGSGKTVTLRSIITDATARGFTTFCVDPKRVELTGLRGWPGVRAVASTTEEMIALVTMLADEMDERYADIEAGEVTEADLEPVLVVLDEMTEWISRVNEWWKHNRRGGTGTEHPVVARFRSMARLGRTGRIHLVVGIQRPDAKVFGGEARDNFGFRVALGKMGADGARMVFGRTDVARDDALALLKGRATVGTGEDGATEVQTYYTPNPRECTPDEQRHLDALAAAARGRASQAVAHINADSIRAYALAMNDPDAPVPSRPRKRKAKVETKIAEHAAREGRWERVGLDDLAEGDFIEIDVDGQAMQVTVAAPPCPVDDDEHTFLLDYGWGDGHTGSIEVDEDERFERLRMTARR